MKIVFCGPPHSGKSVFIANLIAQLPSDGYTIIRACPDGEGTWSNNKNQKETSIVRKKGKFTQTFIDNACKAIDNQTNKIVLVDVGGVMSKENEQVFQHCDSFVVLSSDEEKKKEWLEFGQKLGLQCIGYLDSSLEGQEEIYSKEPYFSGKIVGLERGEILNDSPLIKGLVSDIVKKSRYAEHLKSEQDDMDCILIDDTELGFELGYGKEVLTDDGIPIKIVLENTLKNATAKAKAQKIVEEAIEKSQEHIMVLEQFVPWQEFIFSSENDKASEVQFVVFPSNRGGYNWQCVPDALGSFGQRKTVPSEWRGLSGENLQKVTGVPTANFCHSAGFLGSAETFEGAYALARIAVEA